MARYGIGIIPLIEILQKPNNTQKWYADDGSAAGFTYCFEMDNSLHDDDIKIEQNDKTLVAIDPDSLEYIKGSVLDYQDELIRSAFRITENPNASKEGGCSCGASFNLNPNMFG
ncbi:iron-sulfur cluster insertion protein ErpA-like [Symsagittifera roscoffensis]|uniref:iron-sulfur cluster insertion protein ErpA-like n=1 Tax=Symsagittifera roscoffensis TaxID=84072 RepID=UPI00307B4734